MSSIHICADNPFRPADWRWQRAREIVDGMGLNATRRRDGIMGYKWISRAVRYLEQFDACRNDRQKMLLAESTPDIFWAHWAYDSAVNPQKFSIEAHILARETDFEIGYRCGLPPTVVEAYESVFFNAREKLVHPKYVLNCIMGPAIHRGLSEREFDLLWKLYGYFLGPCMLDAMESKFSSPTWCNTPDAVGSTVLDDAVGTLKLKASIAAKTVPVNQHTQLAIMEQFTKFVEVERNTDTAGKAQAAVLDHIQAMMTCLPFNIGGRDPRNDQVALDRGPLAAYEQSAIELTYEETMRVSVRQPIANAATLVALSFPVTEATQLIEADK